MQQQGGSPYGVPPQAMAPFPPQLPAEAARPPPPPPPPSTHSLDDLVSAAAGSFPDDDGGGGSGNRWPRQETLALLKIRSDMDAAFRDAPIKGPLWEDVSKKLAEQGYIRSSKKCKEKFENVHKYYKRTKETKASRPDGKSYRFFTQLEALHTTVATMAQPITTASPAPSPTTPIGANVSLPSSARVQPPPISAPLAPTIAPTLMTTFTTPAAMAGITFSSDTFTTSSESDEASEGRKRKREGASGGASAPGVSRKIMEFFEGLMKQVTDRQEAMQQRFMEAFEKTEQDRVAREEAWKRQEMARLSREHEILAQERAMAASRDVAVIAFLQKISGYPLQAPPVTAIPAATAPPKPQPQPVPPPTNGHAQLQVQIQQSSSSTEIVAVPDGGGAGEGVPASSRWPKQEIHTLINIRSGLEERYQEAGPKGPLWEEISAAMARQGYNRSSKRCKEKWENINKYFKKVRESNKKRPEDAKTCPYYHDLELLYRRKLANGGGANGGVAALPPSNNSNPTPHAPISLTLPQLSQQLRQPATENKNSGNGEVGGNSGTVQIQANNGGPPVGFVHDATIGNTTMKKPEVVMKMMGQQHQQQASMDDYDNLEEHGSDDMDDEDDEEDDEDMKMQYTIQYQKQNGGGDASSAKQSASATTGPFLAMVQ